MPTAALAARRDPGRDNRTTSKPGGNGPVLRRHSGRYPVCRKPTTTAASGASLASSRWRVAIRPRPGQLGEPERAERGPQPGRERGEIERDYPVAA